MALATKPSSTEFDPWVHMGKEEPWHLEAGDRHRAQWT